MGYSFNGTTKIISLTPGTTTFEAKDLYSRWKDWAATSDNAKYDLAMTVVGGDTTSGANFIYPYFFLENGWRIRPQEANHQLVVDGALLVQGGGNPYLSTLGSYNVQIVATVPVRAEGVDLAGGGAPSAVEVANAVWEKNLTGVQAEGSAGQKLRDTLSKLFFKS